MTIKIKYGQLLVFGINFTIISCGLYTRTTYRHEQKQEYYRECGFVLTCEYISEKDISPSGTLLVSVFTPDTWGDFYYSWLGGIKCEKKVTTKSVTVKFPNSTDTLHLAKVTKDSQFYFVTSNLKELVKNNKTIEIKIHFSDNDTEKIFVLQRHKHTTVTGGKFPAGC